MHDCSLRLTKMVAFIKKVVHVGGIRALIFIFVVMVLMLFIQQSMIVTPKQTIVELHGDVIHNMKGIRPRLTDDFVSTSDAKDYTKQDVIYVKEDFFTDRSKWNEELSLLLGRDTSNMNIWKFNHTVECPIVNIRQVNFPSTRLKVSLNWKRSNDTTVSLKRTNDTSDIYVAPFGDECVDFYIRRCCRGNYRVPNVVHYVWYMRGELSFVGFTSLISVIRFVRPCVIIFHGDSIPNGKYWDFIVNISPNIVHLKRARPETISGQEVKYKEHSSDVMRIEALLQYGGIYMDTDTIIVKSIESLRKYPCVMSNQSSGLMGSAFVMAEKNAKFIQLWMDGYRYHYNSSKYIYNAMIYPFMVARKHRDLIHIEYGTISRPIGLTDTAIYNNEYATYNWSNIYGIHLFSRIYKKPFNEYTIRNMNTTVGSISRHVIFGNKELCS